MNRMSATIAGEGARRDGIGDRCRVVVARTGPCHPILGISMVKAGQSSHGG